MKRRYLGIWLVALMLVPGWLYAQPVVHHPQPAQGLEARWVWALEQGGSSAFWIGYSFHRQMGADAFVWVQEDRSMMGRGTMNVTEPSLYERVYGMPPPRPSVSDEEALRREAERILARMERRPQDLVARDIAVLFRVRQGQIEAVEFGNIELPFELDGRRLYWMGEAAADESLALLMQAYEQTTSEKVQEPLVEAVGAHSEPERVVPFLRDVLASRAADDVREEAASWLGYHHDPRVVPLLKQTALVDRSAGVQEEAVEALGYLGTDEALAALIDLSTNIRNADVREEVIESLGCFGDVVARETLERMAFEDPDGDVQEEAVEALAQQVPAVANAALTRILNTHPSAEVREEALEHVLPKTPAPEQLDLLTHVVYNDTSLEMQEEALEALMNLPEGAGIAVVAEVAREHPRRDVRLEAIDALEDSKDRRAREALEGLLPGR